MRADVPKAPRPLLAADPARLGGYELMGRLGTGGQGVVYLGQQGDRQVAVKRLHSQLLANENARARFHRELEVLRRVAGFCTAQIIDAETFGDQPYIVSEYVPGPSLYELVRRDGPRAGADLDRLAISTMTALIAIHGAGIVHRDFKPQNVLMGPDGPRVIDFGIARALDAGSTVTSQVIGTPTYMAPEQFSGARVGPAADLFAWATTMLFAATGRDPFAGGPLPAVMYRVLHDTPDLRPLPPALAEVAGLCLAKDPAARDTAENALLRLLGKPPRPPAPAPTAPATGGTAAPAPGGTAAPATGPAAYEPAPGPATGPVFPPPTRPYEHTGWYEGQQRAAPVGPHEQTVPAPPHPPPAPYPPESWQGAAPYGPAAPDTWGAPVAPAAAGRPALRRTPALVTGLVLGGLAVCLDLVVAAGLASDSTSSPQVIATLVITAVVTLAAVVWAWLGSRAALSTVIATRVVRFVGFLLWAGSQNTAPALTFNLALLVVVTAPLGYALIRAVPRSAAPPIR